MTSLLKHLALALLLVQSGLALPQTFPDRPVRILIGFPAGTSVDIAFGLINAAAVAGGAWFDTMSKAQPRGVH